MSFFGVPLRNGIPLGLGTVAALSSAGAAVAPATGFTVLPSAGTPSYNVTLTVLDSAGTSYVVSSTVKDSAGTSYTPI